jgi:enoyl-CoA hydratase/carnithine racemase
MTRDSSHTDRAEGIVKCEVNPDGVALIKISRGIRNTLNEVFAEQILSALLTFAGDDRVRVILLTAVGDPFCLGADLSSGPRALPSLFERDGAYANRDYREPVARISLAIRSLPVPVIVAINGDAIGGGATITLAADIRMAAEKARFAFPFTRLGISPEGCSTYYLPRLVGYSTTYEWLLTGRLISAGEALSKGLVSAVYPGKELFGHALACATDIARHTSATAIDETRRLLGFTSHDPNTVAIEEGAAIARLASQHDCLEATAAFLERRQANFQRRDENRN